MSEAADLLKSLLAEEAIMQKLRDAIPTNDASIILAAIEATQSITLDADRKDEINRARQVVRQIYAKILLEAIKAGDENEIRDTIVPKVSRSTNVRIGFEWIGWYDMMDVRSCEMTMS